MILNEEFGESQELNDFIDNLQQRFNPYYEVTLKLGTRDKVQHRYFAYESAAMDYYNKLKEEQRKNKDYYSMSEIAVTKVTLTYDEDELDSEIYFYDDDEDEVEFDPEDDNVDDNI